MHQQEPNYLIKLNVPYTPPKCSRSVVLCNETKLYIKILFTQQATILCNMFKRMYVTPLHFQTILIIVGIIKMINDY